MKQTFLGYPHEDERTWIEQNYKEPNPLCFTSRADGSTVIFSSNGTMPIQYQFMVQIDDSEWQKYQFGQKILLDNGHSAKFKTALPIVSTGGKGENCLTFRINGAVEAAGDVTTLLDPAGGILDLTDHKYAFAYLFRGCQGLTKAPELPSTFVACNCYYGMFQGCTNLEEMPELPATIVDAGGYASMFSGCTRLTEAKNLLAIMCQDGAYAQMFEGCTSLKKAPLITAFELGDDACYRMFAGCSSLNEIQTVFQEWFDSYGITREWVDGVANAGTFKCLPSLPHDEKCYDISHIPVGWNVEVADIGNYLMIAGVNPDAELVSEAITDVKVSMIKTGKEAPAVSLEWSYDLLNWQAWSGEAISTKGTICYIRSAKDGNKVLAKDDSNYNTIVADGMFTMMGDIGALLDRQYALDLRDRNWCFAHLFDSSNNLFLIDAGLLYIDTSVLPMYACKSMFENAMYVIETINIKALSFNEGCFESMYKNCNSMRSATLLDQPRSGLAERCFASMFEGCTRLNSVFRFDYHSTAPSCFHRMFAGCTSMREFPKISIMQDGMTDNCFTEMFDGCQMLSRIDVRFSEWRDDINATQNWVRDVASNGMFACPVELQQTFDDSHIPIDWMIDVPVVSDAFSITPSNCALDFAIHCTGKSEPVEFQMSLDNGQTWKNYGIEQYQRIECGQTMLLRAGPNCNKGMNVDLEYGYRFGADLIQVDETDPRDFRVELGGDITTLLDRKGGVQMIPNYTFSNLFEWSQDFKNVIRTVPYIPDGSDVGEYAFCRTFMGMYQLEEVPAMKLNKVMQKAFFYAFYECQALKTASDIEAAYAAEDAFGSTFAGCNSLYQTPKIKVDGADRYAFRYMFDSCSQLEVISEISYGSNVIELAMQQMFNACALVREAALNAKTIYAPSGKRVIEDWLLNACGKQIPGTLHCPELIAKEIEKEGRSTSTIPNNWTIDVIK